MEKYFAVSKPRRVNGTLKGKEKEKSRYQPYSDRERIKPKPKERIAALLEQVDTSDGQPSSSTLTKLLLQTLSDESNPLTHSDIHERSDTAVSISTGHQIADGGAASTRPGYLEARNRKLVHQQQATSNTDIHQVLRSTRIYINGFLAGTTDIEMKRLITLSGGQVLLTPSGATHILTSQGLSASKTQKILTSKKSIHVVKPEWVTDSINANKRQSERLYSIIKTNSSATLLDMWSR